MHSISALVSLFLTKRKNRRKKTHTILSNGWFRREEKKSSKITNYNFSFLFLWKKTNKVKKKRKKILFIVFSWVNSSSSFNWHFYLWHIQSEISIIYRRFDHCKDGFFKLISFFCTVHTMFWCAVFSSYFKHSLCTTFIRALANKLLNKEISSESFHYYI